MNARRIAASFSHYPPLSGAGMGAVIFVVILVFTGDPHPLPAIIVAVLTGLLAWALGWFLHRAAPPSNTADKESKLEDTEIVLERLKFFKLDTGDLRLAFGKGVGNPAVAIADFILGRGEIKTNILMGYEQHGARKWGRRIF